MSAFDKAHAESRAIFPIRMPGVLGSKRVRLPVLASIFLGAFLIRSFRMYHEFYSGDMALLADYVLDSIPDKWTISALFPNLQVNVGNPLRLLAYDWSPLSAVLTFANVLFFSSLGV